MTKSTVSQRALWLSIAPSLAVLSSIFTLFIIGMGETSLDYSAWWGIIAGSRRNSFANAWSIWLLVTGVFSMLSSLDGIPSIFRSTFHVQLKGFLLALHLGGVLTFVVPLVLFVYGMWELLSQPF